MFDEPFRASFSRVAQPVVAVLARGHVAPNHITVSACGIGLAAAALLANGFRYTALAVWLISRVGDGLDGALARQANRSSAFGGYLDITLDMTAYAAMIVAFAVLYPQYAVAWAAVLAGYVLVITTTLALSDAAGALGRQVSGTDRTFQFTPGFAEAGETNVAYTLWVIFPEHISWLVWIWVAILAATGVQRSYLAFRTLR